MKLNNKKYWKIVQISDIDKLFPNKNRMIQGMKELLPILQGFISDEIVQKHFNPKIKSLHIVFESFLSILHESLMELRTSISFDKNYYIDLTMFLKYKTERTYLMALDFLPDLYKTNQKLYNIVIEALRLVIKGKCVSCMGYSEHDWTENDIESMSETAETQDYWKEVHKDYEKYWEKYTAILMYEGNLDKLLQLMKKYKPIKDGEKILIEFTRKLINTYNTSHDMVYYDNIALEIYHEEYCEGQTEEDEEENGLFPEGYPCSPDWLFEFVWFQDNDLMNSKNGFISEIGNQIGNAEFYINYRCDKPKDIKKYTDEFYSEHQFLDKLADTIEYGMENIKEITAYSKNKLI